MHAAVEADTEDGNALSPGALPAARVVGAPPSCCAMRTVPISIMISARITVSAEVPLGVANSELQTDPVSSRNLN